MFEEKAHRIPLDHDFRGPKGKGKKGSAYAMEQDDPGDSYYENSEWDDSRSWTGDHETMDYVGDNGWWDASNWHQDAWWQSPDWNEGGVESWPAEESTGQTSDQDETVAHLLKEQEEAERSMSELQALMAENTRNLVEARRAVAAAAKDRGWNQPPQQRQPKPTSSYKGFKGSSKNKGKVNYYEDASWMKGKGQPFQKGGFGKNYNYGKGKGNSNKGFSKSINYMWVAAWTMSSIHLMSQCLQKTLNLSEKQNRSSTQVPQHLQVDSGRFRLFARLSCENSQRPRCKFSLQTVRGFGMVMASGVKLFTK